MKFYLKDANLKKNYPEKNTEILEIEIGFKKYQKE